MLHFLLLLSCTASDDFDANFTGKTLRFDYFHTGNHETERLAFDSVRLEGDWPGSRTQMTDLTPLGGYLFELVEANDSRVLFSRSFDSIFGEWQTTNEAKEGWGTFHESQRFPEPRRECRLVVKTRSAGERFEPLFSRNLNPAGPFVNRALRMSRATVWPLRQSGDSARKLDLAILGDGYTADERERFHDDAGRLAGELFKVEPFRSRADDFNVWGVDVAAAESGISDPRRRTWRDSPLGFAFNAFGIDRYVLSYENRAIRDVAAVAPYDALVVICNGRKHGGGGIYNLWAVSAARSPTSNYVFVHELGHALAALADEYYAASVAYQFSDGPPDEPISPNATALRDPKLLKWRDLVDADTPLPTPWNQADYDRQSTAHQGRLRALETREAGDREIHEVYAQLKQATGVFLTSEKHAGKVGAFEGANYRAKGLYRPEIDCIMFSQNRGEFCRVCSRAIDQAIDRFVR